MYKSLLLSLLVVLLLSPSGVDATSAQQLHWLSGHWCGENEGSYNEEVWLAPDGGMLLGMHRDIRAQRLAGFEFLRIVEQDGALLYLAQPGGAPAVAFRAEQVEGSRVRFVNPQHDFPKRVSYALQEDGTLEARIDDGSDDGQAMHWIWSRQCR